MNELCNFKIIIYCWFDRELGCTKILHLQLDLTQSFRLIILEMFTRL